MKKPINDLAQSIASQYISENNFALSNFACTGLFNPDFYDGYLYEISVLIQQDLSKSQRRNLGILQAYFERMFYLKSVHNQNKILTNNL